MTPPVLRLHDTNFTGDVGSSRYHPPTELAWTREGADTPVTFYTDRCLARAAEAPRGVVRVAWLIEPRVVDPEPYAALAPGGELRGAFDMVLTHDAVLAATGGPCVAYPCGMSWVAADDWARDHAKRGEVSLIASTKRETEGHRLRHAVVDALDGTADAPAAFGRGYRPVEHKVEALGPYRFSVVIENCRADWYFSEKLLDCLAAQAVPIYWGCPEVARFYDDRGMLCAATLDELVRQARAARRGGAALYAKMRPYVEANRATARAFACPEDWIARNVLRPNGLL